MALFSRAGIANLAVLFAATCGSGQGPSGPTYSCEQLYEKAKVTASAEGCTEVLAEIETARQQVDDEARRQYLTKLLAWLHNRRGEMHSGTAGQLVARGDLAGAKKQDELARTDFERALELDPTRWKSQHNLGVACALAGQLDEAVQRFTTVVQQIPDYADAWFNRAEVQYEAGRFALAIQDYTKTLELRPEDSGVYAARGHAHFQLHNFERALEDYAQAVQLAPDRAEYLVDRGDVHRAVGRWEQAAQDYRRAVDLNPRLGRAYQSAAWLMATCPDPRFRNLALAVEAAEKAIELDGDRDFVYLDTLAAAYANADRFVEAGQTIQRALEAAPPAYRGSLKRRQQLYASQQAYRQANPNSARQARR